MTRARVADVSVYARLEKTLNECLSAMYIRWRERGRYAGDDDAVRCAHEQVLAELGL